MEPRSMGSDWSRREFLRTLTSALAMPIAPQFRAAGESRLIIGLGGAGINIQRRLQDDGFPARYWVWNSEASFFADVLTRFGDRVPKPMRTGRARRLVVPDAILGEAVLLRRFASDALKEFRTPSPRVAIVVGLGGLTGSALVAPVAEQFLQRTDQVLTACTIPFRFEGRNHRRRADQALAKVVGLGCRLAAVECEATLKMLPPGVRFSDALAWIDRCVATATREWFVGKSEA